MGKQCKLKVFIIALLLGVVVILPLFNIEVCADSLQSNTGRTLENILDNSSATTDINPVLELNSASGIDELCTNVNKVSQEAASFNFITKGTTNAGKTKITLDMSTYSSEAVSSEERRDIIETALTTVNDSNNISGQAKTRIYNFIANQDTATSSLVRQLSNDVNADFATAYSWFKPFTGGISTVLGLVSLGIFICLTFMILVDISFLVIPGVQYALSSTTDGKKAKFVSNEAWLALQEVEKEAQSGKSALGIYFKRKAVQLIILSVCLLYLVGGKIYTLIGWVIDSFQGVVG